MLLPLRPASLPATRVLSPASRHSTAPLPQPGDLRESSLRVFPQLFPAAFPPPPLAVPRPSGPVLPPPYNSFPSALTSRPEERPRRRCGAAGRPEGGGESCPGRCGVWGRPPDPAAPSGDHQQLGITIWQHVLPGRSPPSATGGSLLRRCPQQRSAHAQVAGAVGGPGYGAAQRSPHGAHAHCGAGAAGHAHRPL